MFVLQNDADSSTESRAPRFDTVIKAFTPCFTKLIVALIITAAEASSRRRSLPTGLIDKSTFAGSARSAIKAGKWMVKYLPCYEATDDCANATCSCGTQGSVTINNSKSYHGLPGFGLHVVEARGTHSSRRRCHGGGG